MQDAKVLVSESIAFDLAQLDMSALKALFRQILRLNTFVELKFWISDHMPERVG